MKGGKLDWTPVRESIKKYGMRNSNCMAIAPTATISNIVGTIACIEPIYKNIFVKANMNGDFIVINSYLTKDLKALGLWDYEMIGLLKYNDGSVKNIPQVPQSLKEKYKEVFEIDPKWLLRTAAYRGKWIDQSQSLNIYYSGSSGKELANIYEYAWKLGLKTTYYLRTLGASQVEKSTVNTAEFGVTHKRDKGESVPTTSVSGIVSEKPVEGYVSTMQATVLNANASHSHLDKEAVFVSSKPIEIPKDAPKVVYNITKAPEATCDGCQ
jgi:ribonucleoside-diphosphate reductase alpha chain